MATIGHLKAMLSLNSAAFERGTKRSILQLSSLRSGFGLAGRALSRFGVAIAGIGGIAGFGFAMKRQLEELDTVAKASDRLNIASEKLIGFQYAAELAGSSSEELTRSLEFMLRAASEAVEGNKELRGAFAALAIDVTKFVSISTEDKLLAIADGFERLGNTAQSFDVIRDIMGRGASGIINVIAGGRKELEGFVDEAKKLGFAFDRLSLEKIENANDAMLRARRTLGGIVATIGVQLAPAIEAAANWLARMVSGLQAFGGLKSWVTEWAVAAAKWLGTIADFFRFTLPLAIIETRLELLRLDAYLTDWAKTFQLISQAEWGKRWTERGETELGLERRKGFLLEQQQRDPWAQSFMLLVRTWFRDAELAERHRRGIAHPPEKEQGLRGMIDGGLETAGLRSFKELGIIAVPSPRGVGGAIQNIQYKQLSTLERIYVILAKIEKRPQGLNP